MTRKSPHYKVVFVQAKFKNETKLEKTKVDTGKKKTTWLGKEKPVYATEYKEVDTGNKSKSKVDAEALSVDLNDNLNKLYKDDYEVVSITSVMSGDYDYKFEKHRIGSSKRIIESTEKVGGYTSFGYGYGFSFTEGILITAMKKLKSYDK